MERGAKIPMNSTRNAQISAQIIDFANLMECFEACLAAYRDFRWEELLTYLAPQPRSIISKALTEKGEEFIIETGETPDVWMFQDAMPVSAKRFHVYALMANCNQGKKMLPFRLTFVRAPKAGKIAPLWLLLKTAPLSDMEYDRGIEKCQKWAPEHFTYPSKGFKPSR